MEREGEAERGTRALHTQLRFRKTLKAREGKLTGTINDRLWLDALIGMRVLDLSVWRLPLSRLNRCHYIHDSVTRLCNSKPMASS